MNKRKIEEIKKIYSEGIATNNNITIQKLGIKNKKNSFFNNVINKLSTTNK